MMGLHRRSSVGSVSQRKVLFGSLPHTGLHVSYFLYLHDPLRQA